MARIRSVKPSLRTSAVVASWPREIRYAWVLLWGYLDDYGRGLDVPKGIAGDLFPRDDDVTARRMDSWLSTMANGSGPKPGPLCRYEVDGIRYLHCPNWSEHQRVNRPTPSIIPPCPLHEPPPKGSLNGSVNSSRDPGERPPRSRRPDATRVGDGDGDGDGDGASLRSAAARTRCHTAAEPAADGEPGAAEKIITGWIRACPKRPPGRVVDDIGRHVAAMLAEGIDPDDVTAGLRLWHDHGKLGPNALPSLVHQAMNAPPPPSNVVALRPSEPAQSTADRKVNAGLRLAAKYDAIGEEATP